jgi:hypothetical protein
VNKIMARGMIRRLKVDGVIGTTRKWFRTDQDVVL